MPDSFAIRDKLTFVKYVQSGIRSGFRGHSPDLLENTIKYFQRVTSKLVDLVCVLLNFQDRGFLISGMQERLFVEFVGFKCWLCMDVGEIYVELEAPEFDAQVGDITVDDVVGFAGCSVVLPLDCTIAPLNGEFKPLCFERRAIPRNLESFIFRQIWTDQRVSFPPIIVSLAPSITPKVFLHALPRLNPPHTVRPLRPIGVPNPILLIVCHIHILISRGIQIHWSIISLLLFQNMINHEPSLIIFDIRSLILQIGMRPDFAI